MTDCIHLKWNDYIGFYCGLMTTGGCFGYCRYYEQNITRGGETSD